MTALPKQPNRSGERNLFADTEQHKVGWFNYELSFGGLAFVVSLHGLVGKGELFHLGRLGTWIVLLAGLAMFGHGVLELRRSIRKMR